MDWPNDAVYPTTIISKVDNVFGDDSTCLTRPEIPFPLSIIINGNTTNSFEITAKIYPNPAIDRIKINHNLKDQQIQFILKEITKGTIVFSKNVDNLSDVIKINSVPPSVYIAILQSSSGGVIWTEKVVIK